MEEFICENLGVTPSGHLTFAGQDTVLLAEKYQTPLYLMDEDRIRFNIGLYRNVMRECFPEGSGPLYAGKAASFKQLYRIMKEEDAGIDVVSKGEIYTAASAGFDMGRAFFHSNNKTDDDISYAMDMGVGYFVADSREEVSAIEKIAAEKGRPQKLLLRLTPGIDPHTYAEVSTGRVDSKFGTAIETGQAEELTCFTLSQKHIILSGFHCHVGSQVFYEDVFERAANVMLEFMKSVSVKYGYFADILDMGGGIGVRYTLSDPAVFVEERIRSLSAAIHEAAKRLDYPVPVIHMEPGRSIVADAGMTLYTAGAVKKIPGYKNYVSVDGGMSDNPRYALYKAPCTCLPAGRMTAPRDMMCSLVGRLCESGDILQENIYLPSDTKRDDLIAVLTTGAYNYSMASNYNRLPRPPIVMLKGGESYIAVRRETPEDVAALDM